MMHPLKSDEMAAELRSVRPGDERNLALNTGCMMWLVGFAGVLIASFVLPTLVPDQIWLWRAAWAVLSLAMAVSHITWMKKVPVTACRYVLVATTCVWVLATAALMLAAPAAVPALTLNLLPPAIFAAFFFRVRETIGVVALATAAAIFPVFYDYDAAIAEHMISWLAVLIPLIWMLALVVTMQRDDHATTASAAELQVFSDSLTGIDNIRALRMRAGEMLGAKRDDGRVAALLLVDIDDLGTINRELGQQTGDAVVHAVGQSLARAASGNHLVARVSSDVFAVLIENAAANDVKDTAIRYRNAVRAARCTPELPGLRVDANIGMAIRSADADSLEELLTEADKSLNENKRGRGGRRPAAGLPSLPNEFRKPPEELPAKTVAAADDANSAEHKSVANDQSRQQPRVEHALLGRPEHALLAGAGWFFAITIVLVSLAMPDADRSMVEIAVPFLLICYLSAALNLFFAPEIGSIRHLLNDANGLAVIAVGAYLVGGSDGPGWLVVFVFIAYEGWFMNTRALLLRLVGPVLVVLAPLVYESLGPGEMATGSLAALYAGVIITCTLGLAMGFNRMCMERARTTAEWLTSLDPLTGLANRGAFNRHLNDFLETLPYQAEDALAVVMIDLNGFSHVNRERGYAAGDDLLVEFAAAMRRSLREQDMLARIDGDEFAVVLQRVGADEATLAAKRLVGVIAQCADAARKSGDTAVTASAGFSLYPLHGRSLDELVNAADLALQTVKSGSQSRSRVSRLVIGL